MSPNGLKGSIRSITKREKNRPTGTWEEPRHKPTNAVWKKTYAKVTIDQLMFLLNVAWAKSSVLIALTKKWHCRYLNNPNRLNFYETKYIEKLDTNTGTEKLVRIFFSHMRLTIFFVITYFQITAKRCQSYKHFYRATHHTVQRAVWG